MKLNDNKIINSAHDISSGGMLVALSEMVIESNIGVKILKPQKLNNLLAFFFW